MKIEKKTIASLLISLLAIALVACDRTTVSENIEQSESVQKKSQPQTQNDKAQSITKVKPKFTVLKKPLTVSTGDKIEVLELFWYGCGHCFALEPFIKNWLVNKPSNAEFVKTPAIFSQQWAFHGQAYYAMQALGVLDQANDSFFKQLHTLRKPINDLPALVEFLSAYGKTETEIITAFKSFEVNTKLNNAIKITKQSESTGVPSIIVDGKYLTSVSSAGGQSQLFDLVNELIEKAESER